MTQFKDQPLARKALILGVVPTVCAIALVGVASVASTYLSVRRNAGVDMQSQAMVIAENVSAALAFRDQASAASTLHAMHARTNVDAVCVFDAEGLLFASYVAPHHICSSTVADVGRLGQGTIVAQQLVTVGPKMVGTVWIAGNFDVLYSWIRRQTLVIFGAFIGGALVAVVLTRRIQRVVSSPVLDLAATADAISARRDYSLRATPTTGDEVGGLVRSFNAMLDEIQRRNDALTIEIAERKRAEHLKDEFLAAVSHELRTPLNAVLGWSQLLQQGVPTQERLARALEIIERNARAQARMIEDLLDVSRIVSGKLNVRSDVVDLRSVIASAMDVMSTAAAAKSIVVTVETPDSACLVIGDADRLQQIVLNVITNAMKFTPAAGRIAVELKADDARHEHVLRVSDTGIGISPAFLPHVFDRFRQADGSSTRRHGGLGLGLTIVHELTELHGGEVIASSEGVDQGATFTIRLPQLGGAASTPRPPSSATSSPVDLLYGLRVLVADDEPSGLETAAMSLEQAGASVVAVGSGEDAIERWEAGPFDVLVCDLGMPGVDGFSVLSRLRAPIAGSGRPVAAVALTAYASTDSQKQTRAAGFQVHVAKPYDIDDLVRAVLTARQRASADAIDSVG